MTEIIASLISNLDSDMISDLFIYLILFLFVFSIMLGIKGKGGAFTANTPNLLTSLGILGTFVGIVSGLMDFDPKNIDGSIESLLGGLKTAFLTSLMGMATSILYKGVDGFINRKEETEDVHDIGPEQIHRVMMKQLEASEEIIKSIRGEEESSLGSQIRLLRSDLNDGNKQLVKLAQSAEVKHDEFQLKLWQKMEEFGDLLSKSATEQVINALKEVIVEFNDKLTEQFGENFKRLDESVKKLVDWQENYRHQLEDMAEKYQLGVDAIALTEKSVASINERAESIPVTMEKLHQVMELGHGQVTELEERLEAFKDLRDKAVEAMPQIREHMDETISTIGQSVQAASTHYESMLAESQRVIDSFSQTADTSINTMKTEIESGANKVSEELVRGAQEIGGKLVESATEVTTTIGQSVEAASTHYEGMLTESQRVIDNFSQAADTSIHTMKTEIESGANKVSEELMRGAQDISGKLTESAQDITTNVGSASGALNETANHISNTTEQVRQHLEDMMVELNGEIRALVSGIKEDSAETGRILTTANNDLVRDTKAVQDATQYAITQMQQRLETSLEEVFQIQAKAVQRTFDSLEDQITSSVGKTGSAVEKQVEYLDEQMQQEINRTMNEMGQALATITQQFTRDYQKLVREMNNVVSSAQMAN
ncbi:putative membrane protein [Photobacterium aphoticum]|uniref:Putative membrane protein n=1 Tax=Photobacterium aphoticum TaxID=754436 RepID=A0A090QM38_9GAMM|nr:putative membrane protein [Photobacterium aphoticum]